MSLIEKIDKNRLPRHVAIIMDGNGRWAKAKGKDRSFGHQEGVVSVRKIMDAVTQLGLKYLTLYTFSTENWNRPEEEVQALMSLLVSAIHRETPDMMKKNVRLTAIGDLSRLREDAYNTLKNVSIRLRRIREPHLFWRLVILPGGRSPERLGNSPKRSWNRK